jgi:carbon-monoxide dehydrogenase iron sulfur subunit
VSASANFLYVDRSKCTGCRVCEYVCSIAADGTHNPGLSRIRVERSGALQRRVLVGLQCRNPRCMAACPREAIVREGEQVRVREDLCDRCGACVDVCDRLFLPEEGAVQMCDQCNACPGLCPEGALTITTAEALRQARA